MKKPLARAKERVGEVLRWMWLRVSTDEKAAQTFLACGGCGENVWSHPEVLYKHEEDLECYLCPCLTMTRYDYRDLVPRYVDHVDFKTLSSKRSFCEVRHD